jgi:hypothetical protein
MKTDHRQDVGRHRRRRRRGKPLDPLAVASLVVAILFGSLHLLTPPSSPAVSTPVVVVIGQPAPAATAERRSPVCVGRPSRSNRRKEAGPIVGSESMSATALPRPTLPAKLFGPLKIRHADRVAGLLKGAVAPEHVAAETNLATLGCEPRDLRRRVGGHMLPSWAVRGQPARQMPITCVSVFGSVARLSKLQSQIPSLQRPLALPGIQPASSRGDRI